MTYPRESSDSAPFGPASLLCLLWATTWDGTTMNKPAVKHTLRLRVRNVALTVLAAIALIAGIPSTPAYSESEGNEIQTVRVWLKAFIPGEIPGYTMPVPGAPGKTMIPGPVGTINDCFYTDHRGFSSDINAESRINAETVIDLKAKGLQYTGDYSDPSTEVDCDDGDVECQLPGNPSVQFNFQIVTDSSKERVVTVEVVGKGSNPCFTGSPEINFNGRINVMAFEVEEGSGRLQQVNVEFYGMIDLFPAFEMYAAINDGAARTVFTIPPIEGKTPADLFGDANRFISGKAKMSLGLSVGQPCSAPSRASVDSNTGADIVCVYSRDFYPDGVWVTGNIVGVHNIGEPCDPTTEKPHKLPTASRSCVSRARGGGPGHRPNGCRRFSCSVGRWALSSGGARDFMCWYGRYFVAPMAPRKKRASSTSLR